MKPKDVHVLMLSTLLLTTAGRAGGFVTPLAHNQKSSPPQRNHDHHERAAGILAKTAPSSPRAVPSCRIRSWTVHIHPVNMNGPGQPGDDSQGPASDGIDREGIDAKGGTDTTGIYGLAREIIEKEEAEAPFRRLRLIGYAVPAFIAIFLAGVSLAGMAGLEEFKEVSENLPNPLLDAAIVGGAFYLWVEEVKTKRSSLALLKKQYEEESKVPNRGARRQKKLFGKKKAARRKGNPPAVPPVSTAKQPAPSSSEAEAEGGESQSPPAPKKKGMFEGVKETLDAVNKQSYYQALALNKELEEKGVLPPLERKPTPPGGDDKGVPVAEDDAELESAADTAVEAGAAPAATAAGVSKRRKKGKKKGKRSK